MALASNCSDTKGADGANGGAGPDGSAGSEQAGSPPNAADSAGAASLAGAAGDTGTAGPLSCNANFTISNVAFYGNAGTQRPGLSSCPAVTPAAAAITGNNVTTADDGTIVYGTSPALWATFSAHGTGQLPVTLSVNSSGGLTVRASIYSADGSYANAQAGLAYVGTNCLNASQYTGIRFELTGDFGKCGMLFEVIDAEDTPSSAVPGKAECTASRCIDPYFRLTKPGVYEVPFSALANGAPMPTVDTTSIIGMQWLLSVGG